MVLEHSAQPEDENQDEYEADDHCEEESETEKH